MRISTTWQHQIGVNQMLNQQGKLTDTQLKMASGKKYLTPSENPQAAASLIDFNQRIKVYDQYQNNVGVVKQRLGQENSSIDAGINIIMRIRELTVQGLNDTNQGAAREHLASEIDQLNEQLRNIANTQDPSGEYIFSGYASNKPAFDSSYAYQGGQTARNLAIGPERTMADGDTGDTVFGLYDAAATVGNIDNVFQAVAKLSADLKADTPNTLSLKDLDNAMERFSNIQVSVGARLNTLDVQESLNDDYIVDYKSIVSDIGDLDYAQAASDFSLQNVALQFAQKAFAKVQKLSLFNYM